MGPLTEGNIKGNIKSQTTPTKKRNIKHSEKMHDENAIYSIMSICLILGGVCIGSTAESSYLVLPLLYVVSILISLVGIYLLPKFRSVNINHAKNMRRESLILLFVLFLGPIMAMFVLTILLLPPKKRRHLVQLIKLPKKKVIQKIFPGFYWASSKRNIIKTSPTNETRLLIVRISGQEPFLMWETWNINSQSPKRYRVIENNPNFTLGTKIQHYGALNPNIIEKSEVMPGFYWGKKEGNDIIVYVFGEKPFLKILALDTVNCNVYTLNNIDSIVFISKIQQSCVDYSTIKPRIKNHITRVKDK